MITFVYFCALITSLILAGTMIFRNKRIDTSFILLAVMVVMANMGQYFVSKAGTLEMAVWANKILYLGSLYASLTIVVIVARICDLSMPMWLRKISLAAATIVVILNYTNDYTNIYYKSVSIEKYKGATILVKEYGPAHIAYPIVMAYFAVMLTWYLAHAIRIKKEVSTKNIYMLGSSAILIIVIYIVERLFKTKFSYDAIGYAVASLLLARVFDHINKYDMTTNINMTMEKMQNYGYIEFDKKFRYINSNSTVKQLFPEILDEWRIDYRVPVSSSYLYEEIIRWAMEKKDKAQKMVHFYGKCFEVKVSILNDQRSKAIGHIIEFEDRTEEHKYLDAMESFNARLQNEVAVKTENIQMVSDKMVIGMARMVESRDNSTGGHINRTSAVVKIFAKKLLNSSRGYRFTRDFLKQVTQAAPMHDLGKIAVDDAVLRKDGKFTDEEYEKMKAHSKEGARIVEAILRGVKTDEFVDIARNVAFYHHEKWDGSGYPNKLAGHDIPIEARIMALADVFDALVSKRCYKEAFSYDRAFTIIEESLGSHFDPDLGKDFLSCREELEAYYDAITDK